MGGWDTSEGSFPYYCPGEFYKLFEAPGGRCVDVVWGDGSADLLLRVQTESK